MALPSAMDDALTAIAKRDGMPQATKALYLLEMALALEEDIVLDALASKRDTKGVRYIPHDKAWA